jgi:murein DD-endopeptidase MepM/ murein hydrolase activator NlpD
MLADVNGDGKADVVGFGNDHVFTALSNGNGTFQDTIISFTGFTKNQGGWTNFNDYPRMLADVNGDRKADLVAFGNDNVFVALNNGNGTFQPPVSSSPSGVGFTKNKGGWSTFNDYPRLIGNGFGALTSVATSNSYWQKPLSSYTVSSRFGWRTLNGETKFHEGIDLAAPKGTPVESALSGKVIKVFYDDIGGKQIKIDHGNGLVTWYAHLDSIDVTVEQQVTNDTVIGKVGNTGTGVTGYHLHFQIQINGVSKNPEDYLSF